MAEFAVYFDDSGTHDGSKVTVAGGYVSRVDVWQRFAEQWQSFLAAETDISVNEYGVRVFHMTDF